MIEVLKQFNKKITERYGRKKGLLLSYYYLMVYYSGGLNTYSNIDWNRVNRLILVCKGNICRSPYACEKCKTLGIEAASFGLLADDVSSANDDAVRVALKLGIDLSQHKSKTQKSMEFSSSDLFIGMEPWHLNRLKVIATHYNAQVTLLGLWCSEPRPYIQDPFGLCDDYFKTCYGYIDEGVDGIINNLRDSM